MPGGDLDFPRRYPDVPLLRAATAPAALGAFKRQPVGIPRPIGLQPVHASPLIVMPTSYKTATTKLTKKERKGHKERPKTQEGSRGLNAVDLIQFNCGLRIAD
jgi:hypothetical protein